MYNIKIKSVPNKAKTGSQLDYSLVDRNTLFLKPNTPVDSDVKNTMGAVPREKANIEAEGGETVVGDINNDGYLEHQTIVGKRHTQGGVPLNVPEGSFIFSDTKKMMIKDPEVLPIFGMKPNKAGYTPAEIAKKYNINDYIAILKDSAKDKYSKETAQIMLDSNLKKLGMLALVQESMKGFPDGVPAIAESVMGQMMGGQGQESPEEESQEGPQEQGPQEEMQEQPQQRYGGELPKAQFGSSGIFSNPITSLYGNLFGTPSTDNINTKPQVVQKNNVPKVVQKNNIPKIGHTFYINNQPNKVAETYKGFLGDNWVKFEKPIKVLNDRGSEDVLTEIQQDDWDKLMANKSIKVGYKNNLIAPDRYTDISNINWLSQPDAFVSNPGMKYNTLNYSEKPINIPKDNNPILKPGFTYVANNATYKVLDPEVYDREGRDAVKVAQIKDPNRNIGSYFDTDFGTTTIPRDEYYSMFGVNPKTGSKSQEGRDVNGDDTSKTNNTQNTNTPKVTHKDKVGKVYQNPRSTTTPINTIQVNTGLINGIDSSNETEDRGYAYGGTYKMQTGGGVPEFNTTTGMYQNYDTNHKPIGVPYKSGTTYNVRDKDIIDKAKAAGYNITGNKHAPNITYIPEQTSKTGFKWNPDSGIYESPKFPIGKQGLDELVNNWKDELSNYEGPSGKGVDAWKKDLLNQKGQAGPASTYYALEANKNSNAAGLGDQIDTNVKDWNKPGQEWYSTKKFTKQPTQQINTPARKEDNINVQQITPSVITDRGGWSKNATLNALNAFAARRYHGQAVLPKYNAEIPDYSLLNPQQAIAQMQSSVNSMNNQGANTMSGNVAFGAGFGLTGEGIDKAAAIQAQYDNNNVGIANHANDVGAGIANEINARNTAAKYQYNNDIQTLGQQEVNTDNAYRGNVIKSIIGANQEQEKMQALKTMFPQVGIDNWNHNIGWSGHGRDPFGYDPYVNPIGNGSTGSGKGNKGFAQGYDYDSINNVANQVYDSAYKSAVGNMGHDNATEYAKQMALSAAKHQMYSNTPGYGTNGSNVGMAAYEAMFGDNK